MKQCSSKGIEPTYLGLDIGGANIKFSDGTNTGELRFELWKSADRLAETLQSLVVEQPDCVAVTMTGELCDCFESRREGVNFIANAVDLAYSESEVYFYRIAGTFCQKNEVNRFWPEIASANWHATASWLAQSCRINDGVIIDFGSTTTDIIPIAAYMPVHQGSDDFSRLVCNELIYTGLSRTPITMVLPQYKVGQHRLQLAAENFATMIDAYLIAGWIKEDPNNCLTADARPLTKHNSARRIARLLCSEPESIGSELVSEISLAAIAAQWNIIAPAIDLNLMNLTKKTIWVCGEGAIVLQKHLERNRADVHSHIIDSTASAMASTPAIAVREILLSQCRS